MTQAVIIAGPEGGGGRGRKKEKEGGRAVCLALSYSLPRGNGDHRISEEKGKGEKGGKGRPLCLISSLSNTLQNENRG